LIDQPKPGVMPCLRVLGTGVTKAND